MQRRHVLRMAFGTWAATVCGRSATAAGRHPESFRRTTCNRCAVPLRPYADDGQIRGGVSAVSFEVVVAEEIAEPIGVNGRQRRSVRRKSFMIQANTLQFGPFVLRRRVRRELCGFQPLEHQMDHRHLDHRLARLGEPLVVAR